jgi:hypothetical protein
MYIGKPRNIRWVLMFLGRVRSLKNILTYVHWSDQKAEEHKVDPYVPRSEAPDFL